MEVDDSVTKQTIKKEMIDSEKEQSETEETIQEELKDPVKEQIMIVKTEGKDSGDEHAIFTTDPSEWMQYIHKEICVCTTRGTSHSGWVYTIDPVSQSFVLVRFVGKSRELEFVMGHAIKSMFVLNGDTETMKDTLDQLFQVGEMMNMSPEEIKKRKKMVRSWLLKNRIPVTLSGKNNEILNISDALFIEPPYDYENCRSTNEVILGRVQGLIKNIPKDVEDW